MLQINKERIKSYGPFIILFLVMVLIHIKLNVNFGDDLEFAKVLDNKTLFQFLEDRYMQWSSRIIIEAFMVLILQVNVALWKILDVLIVMLLAYSLSKIFNYKNKVIYNYMIVGLIMMYPFDEMASAGWIATTSNYLWPLAIGLFSLCGIMDIINGKKVSKLFKGIYIFATLYACNVEQIVIILLPTYILMSVFYYMKHNRISKLMVTQSIISVLSLIFIVISPGNAARKIAEIPKWYPNYDGLGFIDKIAKGITSTIAEIILADNYIFGVLLIFLSIAIYLKRRNIVYMVISIIPIMIYIFMKLSLSINNGIFKFIKDKYYKNTFNVHDFNYDGYSSYIPIILSVFMIGIVYLLLYMVFGNDQKTLLTMYIWSVGVASRVAMGFSPTIYASNTRTYIFLYFSIISIVLLV